MLCKLFSKLFGSKCSKSDDPNLEKSEDELQVEQTENDKQD